MRAVVGCEEEHSQVELRWLEVAYLRAVLPKHRVQRHPPLRKPSKPCLKLLIKQPCLLGPAGIDFHIQRMHLVDMILVDAVQRVFLS